MVLTRRALLSLSAVSVLLNIAFLARRIVTRYRENPIPRRHSLHRRSLFAVLHPPKNPIVFAGGSLTERCEWRELLHDDAAINRGIGFDTSAGLLKRAGEIAALAPRMTFIMVGFNDPEEMDTADNIRSTADALPNQVVIQSILPTADTGRNRRTRSVNAQLAKLASGRVRFLNLYDDFLAGEILNPSYSEDGVHLNGPGYAIWARRVKSEMRR